MIKKGLFLSLTLMLILSFVGLSWAVEPIKIGMPTPLTGAYVSDGEGYRQGIKTAVEEINTSGGLLGRPLEMIRFDIGDFSPEKLMQAADQLVGKLKVDVGHGGWSGWGQDVRAFGKYEVPFFMVDSSISAVQVMKEDPESYSNCFQLGMIEKDIAVDVFDVMAQLPYSYPNNKIVIIVAEDSWGRETGIALEDRAKEKGWQIAMHEIVPYGTREWGPLLTKIRNIKPAWIHVEIVSPPDLMTFFRQFMQRPINSLINFGYGLTSPAFIANMGTEANGIMGETSGIPIPEGPTHKADTFLNNFKKKLNVYPQSGGYAAYIGMKMWAEAVKAVGDVNNYSAINKYVAETPYEDKNTLGWVKFNKDHHFVPPVDIPFKNLHYQVINGELVTIYSGKGVKYLGNKWQLPPWIRQ